MKKAILFLLLALAKVGNAQNMKTWLYCDQGQFATEILDIYRNEGWVIIDTCELDWQKKYKLINGLDLYGKHKTTWVNRYITFEDPCKTDSLLLVIDSLEKELDYYKYLTTSVPRPALAMEVEHLMFDVYWLKFNIDHNLDLVNIINETPGVSRAYLVYVGNEEITESRIQLEIKEGYNIEAVSRNIKIMVKQNMK